MDTKRNLRDNLLRADGIDPDSVSEPELQWFRAIASQGSFGHGAGRRRPTIRIARWAAAAALVVLASVGMYLLGPNTNRVWAQVLDNVRDADSYRWHATEEVTGDTPAEQINSEVMGYASAEYGVLTEHYLGGRLTARNYLLFESREIVTIDYLAKECLRHRAHQSRDDFSEEIDLRQMVVKALQAHHVEIGRRDVEGRTLAGVETREASVIFGDSRPPEDFALRLWIDIETRLPVRAEIQFALSGNGQTKRCRRTLDQFEWGLALPADLFVPHIPDGYASWTDELDETACIVALGRYAEAAGGRYPSQLRDIGVTNEISDAVLTEIHAREMADGQYRYDRIQDAATFYDELREAGHNVAYYGDRVTPADADSVLMHWDISETQQRVVWADLRIETLTVEELAAHFFTNAQASELIDLLKPAGYEARPVIAHYLASIADRNAIIPLLRCAEQWQGPDEEDPFEMAIETIWRRGQPSDSAPAPLVKGRLIYANGKPAGRARIRLGSATSQADGEGYFAMAGPVGERQDRHLFYAYSPSTSTGRALFWSADESDRTMTVVLDFTCIVSGRLVDETGEPLAARSVALVAQPGARTDSILTLPLGSRSDTEGYFVLESVPAGVPLELAVASPETGSQYVAMGELTPDEKYDIGNIVLGTE